MPDLLLELLSEEIPARMQARAADDLKRLVTGALIERGFLFEAAQAFSTPRRLVLHVVGLPAKGRDVREERKGPRVGAPEAALAGFLKSAGLASADELTVQSDAKKGDVYVAAIERPGRPTIDALAEIVPAVIRSFPWPKSMRWGAASGEPGSLRWVRPLQSILATFGSDVEAPEIVAFDLDGIVAGDVTRGHRFLAPGEIRVRRFDDYVAALQRAKVVLDPARRREIIRHDARNLAFAAGLEVIEDETLLDEVAGLVEWPVVLIGSFDESFLAIPAEAIRATIRANQKCFVLRRADSLSPQGGERSSRTAVRPGEGQGTTPSTSSLPAPHPVGLKADSTSPRVRGEECALANRFVITSNIEASDGGSAIVAGNERVVRARLSDARFFWDADRKVPLEHRLEKLKAIVFHEKLGTQYERVERIAALARELAPVTGADPDLAERAARLAKADLTTEMVGEFPELQGLMGRYYAAAQGQPASVAAAIEEHYRPLGPADRVPTDPVSVAVALADKLDTLVGFWAIDEKPTGSKDPYALRRAALGVIRLVLENGLRAALESCSRLAVQPLEVEFARRLGFRVRDASQAMQRAGFSRPSDEEKVDALIASLGKMSADEREQFARYHAVMPDLLSFFHDRLKVYLRDRGARHDLIDAVLGAGPTLRRHAEERPQAASRSTRDGGASFETQASPAPQDDEGGSIRGAASDDLLAIVRRVEALGAFLATEDGKNLLAGAKRAANILRIEEKKDGRAYDAAPDPAAYRLLEERALAEALEVATAAASAAIASEDYAGAMTALAALRPAVDAFFDKVTVNDPDPALRANRLALLSGLRAATRAVADVSKIEG